MVGKLNTMSASLCFQWQGAFIRALKIYKWVVKPLATDQTPTQFSNSNSAVAAVYVLGYLLRLWTTCEKVKHPIKRIII